MRTKEELAIALSDRKSKENFKKANFGTLVSTMQSLSDEDKSKIIDMLLSGNTKRIGSMLSSAVRKKSESDAKEEVDLLLADDLLSLDEIDELI